jgi:hypothetical protein
MDQYWTQNLKLKPDWISISRQISVQSTLHHNSQLYTIRQLNDYNTLFHFEIECYANLGPLVSKNDKLYHKIHVDCVFSEHTGWSAFS